MTSNFHHKATSIVSRHTCSLHAASHAAPVAALSEDNQCCAPRQQPTISLFAKPPPSICTAMPLLPSSLPWCGTCGRYPHNPRRPIRGCDADGYRSARYFPQYKAWRWPASSCQVSNVESAGLPSAIKPVALQALQEAVLEQVGPKAFRPALRRHAPQIVSLLGGQ